MCVGAVSVPWVCIRGAVNVPWVCVGGGECALGVYVGLCVAVT